MTSLQDRIGTLRTGKLSPEFFSLQADPIFWQSKAGELHRAALLLAQQFFEDTEALRAALKALEEGQTADLPSQPTSVMSQFVLLAAFSLENLFKGLVLYKEPNLVDGGKTSGIMRSHDLLSLASRAGVSLTPEEHRLCVLASSAAVYWGRYPISNSAEVSLQQTKITGHSVRVFDELFQRVTLLFKERFHTRTRRVPQPGA